MKNKPTVFIGIPAYNEAGNIGYLIKSLLSQNSTEYELDKIVVVSDGSTDSTAEIVRSFNNEKVIAVEDGLRKGVATRENEIFKMCNADVLVLLNADIGIFDYNFIGELAKSVNTGTDLAAARMHTIKPKSFVETVFSTSEEMKREMFEKYDGGNNVYTCHGAARAFSPKFYNSFEFKSAVGEDAYSYFYAIENNLKYEYVKTANFYIRSVGSAKDYFRQSTRHANTLKQLQKQFPDLDIYAKYRMPLSLKLGILLKWCFKRPIHLGAFVLLFLLSTLKSLFCDTQDMWELSTSTKVLFTDEQTNN